MFSCKAIWSSLFSYNLLLFLPFSDISVEIHFFRVPSLRIFAGDDIIARVEKANPWTISQSIPGIMAIPRTKNGDMSPFSMRDIRKE